jgi:hypothetical protein
MTVVYCARLSRVYVPAFYRDGGCAIIFVELDTLPQPKLNNNIG